MRVLLGALLFILLGSTLPAEIQAQSSSTNYSIEESSFSTGSGTNSTSANFSARGSAGDLGVGFGDSANFRAYAGPVTPDEEYLEMVVNGDVIELDTPSGDPGVLNRSETATGTATFYVRAYLNSAYSVISASPTLTNENGDTIDPLTSEAAVVVGTEQFGINLVDNATPNIGADPVPEPSGAFANGQAATGYGTADQFRFNQDEAIAESGGAPAWGRTDYTISYIANINGTTEGGFYQMVHVLIAVATF